MEIMIEPGILRGKVGAIPSKSQAHRALICAALADRQTFIECGGSSEDIDATADCLTALGAVIRRDGGGFAVTPICRANVGREDAGQERAVLQCKESGSSFRFMLPIVAALGREASFILRGRLPERPLSPLYEELARHGCEMSPQGAVPFRASGRLAPGFYTLDAGVSSQFVSGLLFALPLLGGGSELRLTGKTESASYIELTLSMLEIFGIVINKEGPVYTIPGGQIYRSPGVARVEGDWSNAAFWLSAGAISASAIQNCTIYAGAINTGAISAGGIGEGVSCVGLDLHSKQGDRAITDILARFGARVEYGDASVTVSGGKLRGINIDARDVPDLVPVLAVVAAAAEGTTVIGNAGRLRGKESDRLAAITAVLRGLGADIGETADGLSINGGKALSGGRVSSYGDHRIAMAAAIAACLCANPVTISGAEAVNKSYPRFFEDLRQLSKPLKGVK